LTDLKAQLQTILGTEQVSDSAECLAAYAKNSGFAYGVAPAYVAGIQSAGQVQECVKLANETKTPLVPASSKGGHRRGGTTPAVAEAVILDLSGMNRILSVNSEFRMAIVEPGVTYGQLQEELKKYGLMIDMPLAPRAEKSVLASVLEQEPRLNPNMQWSAIDPLRCTEVVWGDGTSMSTGDAATGVPIPAQQEGHRWQISPNGPGVYDYYRLLSGSMGTMGVVTWASLKCALLPDVHTMYLIPSDTIDAAVEFAYRVEHKRFGDSLFMMNAAAIAALMGNSPDSVNDLREKLPNWICMASAAGRPPIPEMRAHAHAEGISSSAQSAGLRAVQRVGNISAEDVLAKAFSPCAPGKYWKDTLTGAAAEIFFITTLDKTPEFIAQMNALCEASRYPIENLGVYIQPRHQGVNCHCEFILPYDPDDTFETARARELFDKASAALAGSHAFFSRPYGKWAALQFNKDAMTAKVLETTKEIFDPSDIMNPGKLTKY
jgi:FAD/FMN-containing dehydrogenase